MTDGDVISDVLRAVRLEGTLYFEARMTRPWGFSIPASDHAVFHYVTSGSVWLTTGDHESVSVNAGETVVFPHGAAHRLSHEPGGDAIDGRALFDRMDDDGVVRLGGADDPLDAASMICGHFSFDRSVTHPMIGSLPHVIRSRAERHPGWTSLAELSVAHSRELSPGSRALTDRLAEVLLIEVLNDFATSGDGFVRALTDPTVAAALHALHQEPERDWTVASLSSHVCVSRATLATRFGELVGETPIRYLTRWRMQLAAQLLRDTTLSTAEVAARVGYATPFSFSKAFTRELGAAPSHYRTTERTGARSA